MYTCEFNRHRIIVDPQSTKATYPNNVYQNNVVPVDPTLNKNDPRLFSYDCDLSKPQYTPDTISSFDNYLPTDTAR
eukprot:CAMPEP_0184367240 /NCGR_PEP_ID=MMETSP1089-20130417/157509_1 /TAXON_ID=38269 ORGANISM="Gloeochaete wittrockiana, Strain SAG46.84" /NCGR_SAMPLE_ID=MMETSP1089 /ASSEMBLY_ACC=CAM_ASM_000445 /LENGTH=75 /DNA_ID=CAMNT_0026709159 /DNA_START=1 /DNA_END=224 /DNA_ORIENTATION=+